MPGALFHMLRIHIRDEEATDDAAVEALLCAAFGGADEARLVARLRGQPGVTSYVAVAEDDSGLEVVGHLMFSPIEAERPTSGLHALGLAPLAVHPDRQGGGIGTALMKHGLAACAATGVGLVVLLGHPDYYPRFGFVPGSRHGIACKWSDGDAFQVLELVPGHAALAAGVVRYHPAFDSLD